MQEYFKFTTLVRRNEAPSAQTAAEFFRNTDRLTAAQAGAALAFCERSKAFRLDESQKLAIESHVALADLLRRTTRDERLSVRDLDLVDLIFSINTWPKLIKNVVNNAAHDSDLGYVLAAITLEDLDGPCVTALTQAMTQSGDIYDYGQAMPNEISIRRYPTGALSEKIALMMPTLIASLRRNFGYSVSSPFIVARALGHTGGTWDKLKAIPGFTFPNAGDESLAILRECGTCYSVTTGGFNPADRRLYLLRDETDTIESIPLIVSSIASKMLACPVDLMQLDVRFGPGSFFATREKARSIGEIISEICTSGNMKCFYTLTATHDISGSSVGRSLEVAEAIEALGGGAKISFDERGIELQRQLVADFLARLVAESLNKDANSIYEWVMKGFRNGIFLNDFVQVMTAHKVEEKLAKKLWGQPRSMLGAFNRKTVVANAKGRLRDIDQRSIGRLINAAPDLSLEIRKRLYDKVDSGEPLAELYFMNDISSATEEAVNSAFDYRGE